MENRKLRRCPVCNMPMFEKVGWRIFLLQHYNGQRIKTEIERNVPYSRFSIICGACKQGGYNLWYARGTTEIQDSI